MLTVSHLSNLQTNELVEQLMTRECRGSSSLLLRLMLAGFGRRRLMLTASHLSNFQTNKLAEQLDDKGVSRFFVVVDSNELVQFPDQ